DRDDDGAAGSWGSGAVGVGGAIGGCGNECDAAGYAMRTRALNSIHDLRRSSPQIGDSRSSSLQRLEGGSALIIVLWVAFGLVALTLYFGQSMTFELRAAENRVAALDA